MILFGRAVGKTSRLFDLFNIDNSEPFSDKPSTVRLRAELTGWGDGLNRGPPGWPDENS